VPANTEEEYEEKQTILNMILCFHISTKHYLRNEFGVNFEDLLPLIQNIPEYKDCDMNSNSPQDVNNPQDEKKRSSMMVFSRRLIKLKKTEFTTCEIPLQLNHFILSYFHELHNNRNLNGMLFDHLRSELRDIQYAFMNLKRYMDTPIPLAYTAHLSQCVWISCIFIPFQMLNIAKSNSWVVIPFSTISCFILFGILTLSEEIESPFGFGYNKLPLDKYSKDFSKQLEFIKGLPVIGTSGNQFVKLGQ
jgi:putative membrane protein